MNELDPNSVESSELVEETFRYWFSSHGHVRSPFPHYIHADLRNRSIEKFHHWILNLKDRAKDEINDEILAEKFEEIIFETGAALVLTNDEKLTITYPFLPRVGDKIFENLEQKTGESTIIERDLVKENDQQLVRVKLQNDADKKVWETKFELPV